MLKIWKCGITVRTMSLAQWFGSLDLLGVFLASLVGHLSIVMKDVIFLPVFLYVSQFWDPLSMGLAGGIGGGIGELGAYLVGRGVGKLKTNAKKDMVVPNWARKLGLFSVLLCSVTPIPDAPVLLLIGSARFPILGVLAMEILGKVFLYTTVAAAGGVLYSSLNAFLPSPWDSVFVISAFVGASLVVSSKRATSFILKLVQVVVDKIQDLRKRKKS
jgi:membrane protein YqaA with SNARE-associated domain